MEYIAILIVGGLIGGAIATRHYGVGPLAKLSGIPSSADRGDGANCAELEEAFENTPGDWNSNPKKLTVRDRAFCAWANAGCANVVLTNGVPSYCEGIPSTLPLVQ